MDRRPMVPRNSLRTKPRADGVRGQAARALNGAKKVYRSRSSGCFVLRREGNGYDHGDALGKEKRWNAESIRSRS
jgi:hypothetical protein